MVIQSVDNETITKVSKQETQITRALYRPGIEGKLFLTALEEGVERKISETGAIKESTRKIKEASGRMAVVERLKQTTTKLSEKSFKKETMVQRADDNGRLVLTDEVAETQTENPDGTRKYQRLLESRNINRFIRNVNTPRPILSERVTAAEKTLSDGTIENIIKVERLDPLNLSDGLKLTEIIIETSKPVGNGKISLERVVKTRDVNGSYVVSQKLSETLEPKR
jgi:hypothetical protein